MLDAQEENATSIQGGLLRGITGISHVVALAVASIIAAEFLGYLLHRLMHSGWIPWLSSSHMKHHLVLYAPLQKQRPSEHYLDATAGRLSLGNIGLEWIAPSAVILAIAVAMLRLLGAGLADQAIAIGTILLWSFLMFSYLHDRMHIKNFWMAHAPVLKRWFRRARRLHDIHHHALNNNGLMDKNFGIGFFAFDRLFGTLEHELTSFNHQGHAAATKKFRVLFSDTGRC